MTGILGAIAAYGQAAPPPVSISITDQYLTSSDVSTSTATYGVNNNGTVVDRNSSILETWLLGGGTASDYEIRATAVSGTVTGGTIGSWENLGTSRVWYLTNNNAGNSTKVAVISVSIRLASSGVVQDTASITLSAETYNFN